MRQAELLLDQIGSVSNFVDQTFVIADRLFVGAEDLEEGGSSLLESAGGLTFGPTRGLLQPDAIASDIVTDGL